MIGCFCGTKGQRMNHIQSRADGGRKDGGKMLLRVRPRGFCAGVVRAVDIVELALEAYGPPVYVHHEIVHNRYVVDQLRQRGAIFVETLEEVPIGAVLVFSAHGVPPTVRDVAKTRSLRVIDATCPLVTKVHLEALRFAREKRTIILIGHRDHQEIVGTSGEAPERTIVVDSVEAVDRLQVDDPDKLAFLTQTTLSLYDTQEIVTRLRQKFPNIVGPASDDICYATQNRQEAVEQLAKDVDLILVVGSPNSSNSNRLVEVAKRSGVEARLIDEARDVDPAWLEGVRRVGLAERLTAAGFEVADMGDCAPQAFADDDDHPRARNLAAIVAGLNDLRPRVEFGVKSGALVVVLGGECVQALATLAGARRYYRHVALLWMDRHADLNTPGTTPSGRLDGMAVAHIVGRGAT